MPVGRCELSGKALLPAKNAGYAVGERGRCRALTEVRGCNFAAAPSVRSES